MRDVPGVEAAAGSVAALVRLVDDDNDQLGNGFAPNFVFSVLPEPFVPVTYTEGRAPRNAREAAIDQGTAERSDLGIGDRVGVAGDTSVTRYRIVGINRLGDTSGGGSASATLTLPEAQRVTDRRGKLDQISIAAAPGVNPVAAQAARPARAAGHACARRPGAERGPRGRRDRLRPVASSRSPCSCSRA